MTYDEFEDRWDEERMEQQRRASNLEHIRSYYGLEERCGVKVDIGGRVRSHGDEGTIVDTAGQYLMVLLNGEPRPVKCHVTSGMEYETTGGWVSATPRPTPAAPGAAA
ncbi:hypothetical protein ACFYZ9_33875 [Streptomyces sp. NPDC001691]|uniref:hypothetical protein n=1 Tax=Streptomyces sp. NPDC001691 TaxID=3364600 RepID=UPI0036B5673D